MEAIPQVGDVVASPEQATVDTLTEAAINVANTVEPYRKFEVKGVDIPFGWEDFNGHEVTLSLWASYAPELIEDEDSTMSHEELFASSRDFMLDLSVRYEVDSLPEEAVTAAKNAKIKVDYENLRSIEVEYELNVGFGLGTISWEETRTYYLMAEDFSDSEHVTVNLDIFNRGDEEDEADSEPMELGDLDHFAVMFSGMAKQLDESRIQGQVCRVLALIAATHNRIPIADLSFAHPDAA